MFSQARQSIILGTRIGVQIKQLIADGGVAPACADVKSSWKTYNNNNGNILRTADNLHKHLLNLYYINIKIYILQMIYKGIAAFISVS